MKPTSKEEPKFQAPHEEWNAIKREMVERIGKPKTLESLAQEADVYDRLVWQGRGWLVAQFQLRSHRVRLQICRIDDGPSFYRLKLGNNLNGKWETYEATTAREVIDRARVATRSVSKRKRKSDL